MSNLQSCGDARGSEFDSEILDHFLPNQEYSEGFELDSQNVKSNSQVLEIKDVPNAVLQISQMLM
jgi:hypothetical protein